ncbi:MAG TPA: ThiF family adenylyltransferase [Thermoguttaceae bacterium]|nr:ThiF family adenylyltransferase [Thermoguttaceae bacterium]
MSRSASPHRAKFAEIRLGGPTSAGPARLPAREARLPRFIGLAEPAGPRLDALGVMVIGCGSVGANLVLHSARLQVGELWLVDPGRLKPESLLTHPMEPRGIGLAKVDYFGRMAKAISPKTRVSAFAGPVQSLPLSAFAGVDAVVMATDNLAAEIEVGQRSIYHRKPLVQASVHGDTLVAQVRFWRNDDGSGPCPACGFGTAEWDHVNRETTFSCGGNGHHRGQVTTAPTMSVSFLCSMSAEMAMTQLLRHVLGLGPSPGDSVLEYCGYKTQVSSSPLLRNPACRCEHVAWDRAGLPGPIPPMSLHQIAQTVGFDAGTLPEDLSFLVDDLTFVEQVACCGVPQPVRRFCEVGAVVARCSQCGQALRPQRFYSHRPTPAAVLATLVEEPLERLGARSAEWVVVRSGGRSRFCRQEV